MAKPDNRFRARSLRSGATENARLRVREVANLARNYDDGQQTSGEIRDQQILFIPPLALMLMRAGYPADHNSTVVLWC